MQECDFAYEVLIHDDASTDQTAEVIREYEKKFPDLIKPIYQKENQLSKGLGSVDGRFNIPRVKGKYIAFCEADDYWTDPLKLQKQVNFLEKHPDCSCCHHSHSKLLLNENNRILITGKDYPAEHVFYSREFLKGSPFVRLVSLMLRTEHLNPLPTWIHKAPYGDFPLQLFLATKGDIGYLGGKSLAVYRRGVPGSHTEKDSLGDWKLKREYQQEKLKNHEIVYKLFNKATDNQYKKEIWYRKRQETLNFLGMWQFSFSRKEQFNLIKENKNYLRDIKNRRVRAIWIRFFLGPKNINRLKKML